MTALGYGLLATATALSLTGITLTISGHHRPATACTALSCGLTIPSILLLDIPHEMALLNAASGAWCAWDWWNRGGGDGPRRLFRRLTRRFQGIRRTAPTTA
ncbi:hypothetical protein [Streptomyces sp. AD55]|uniref:hypothetical protein n=1 Tax=Streptomyces sp. AD55 TaxID=3242895 RepID=UPI00352984D5